MLGFLSKFLSTNSFKTNIRVYKELSLLECELFFVQGILCKLFSLEEKWMYFGYMVSYGCGV